MMPRVRDLDEAALQRLGIATSAFSGPSPHATTSSRPGKWSRTTAGASSTAG